MINCAIITARAGSVGLKNKNYLPFGNGSLTQFTIETVLNCNLFDIIILSTDIEALIEENIANKKINLERRPSKLAKSQSTQIEVVLDLLNKKEYQSIDNIFLFQPTSPFRKISEIEECFDIINDCNNEIESVVSISEPINEVSDYIYKIRDKYSFVTKRNPNSQRQDAKKAYFINGSIYGCTKDFLLNNEAFLDLEKSYFYKTSPFSSIDIDNQFQYTLAENLIEKFEQ